MLNAALRPLVLGLCCILLSSASEPQVRADPPLIPAGPTWSNLPPSASTPTPGAEDEPDFVPGLNIRLSNSNDFVAIGPANCPILIAGKQVWDLHAGGTTKVTLPIDGSERMPHALSASGKLLALGMSRDGSHPAPDADVVVINTQTGEKACAIPSVERDKDVEYLGLAGDKWVLICSRSFGDRPPAMEVWNAATGKIDHRFACNYSDPSNTSISPDGNYVALGDEEKIQVYDISTGKVVATMTAPGTPEVKTATSVTIGSSIEQVRIRSYQTSFAGLTGIYFSPKGGSLAALLNTGPQHILCWNNQGALTDNVTVTIGSTFFSHGVPLMWSPDENAWLLYERLLVDRKSHTAVWNHPIAFGDYPKTLFLDANRLLIIHDGSKGSEVYSIPWDKIHQALAAMTADQAAILRPGMTVSIGISCKHPRGDEAEAKKSITLAFVKRLAMEGITVANGVPTQTTLAITLEEGLGDQVHIITKNGPFDFPGTDTGRTAWETRGILHLSIATLAPSATVYKDVLTAQSYPTGESAITNDSLRQDMLVDLQREILGMQLPCFIGGDANKTTLPLGLETHREPHQFFTIAPPETPAPVPR